MEGLTDIVTGVNIYPVKSCHAATINGDKPTQLNVGMTGFEAFGVRDREWLIVEGDGLFVSQRGWNHSENAENAQYDRKLATVAVDIQEETIILSALGLESLEIPSEYGVDRQQSIISIHGRTLWAVNEGDDPAEWFSEFLGRPVWLARASRERPRQLPLEYQRQGASNMVAGADGMAFLLVSQASLDQLHDEADLARGRVSLDRYRANIEIDGNGIGAFNEDKVKELVINGLFKAYPVKACARCPVPNIDQSTGLNDGLSNRLLRRRSGWVNGLSENSRPKPMFGQNLNHVAVTDQEVLSIAVGDNFEVTEIGETNIEFKSSN